MSSGSSTLVGSLPTSQRNDLPPREPRQRFANFLHRSKKQCTISARDKGDKDDEKTKTAPCAGCNASYPFKLVSSQGWAGNPPCVFGPVEGCSLHNPKRLPIAWNHHIPSNKKKLGILEWLFGSKTMPEYDEVQESERIWSTLHRDTSTVDPLNPIYAPICYALAYYHLYWVRSAGTLEAQMSRAASLSCCGLVPGNGRSRPDFYYFNTPWWYRNRFLLKQAVRFSITPKKRDPVYRWELRLLDWRREVWSFKICPHFRHRFLDYSFREKRGLLKACMRYRTTRLYAPLDKSVLDTYWCSLYGPSRRAFNCPHCSTDSCVQIDLVEDKIMVNVIVWKDLGNAKTPFEPQWVTALREKDFRCRRSNEAVKGGYVREACREAEEEETRARRRAERAGCLNVL
ncbi:uncharacterized protein GGS25DRAFT_440730 [Hypoxylon fragiforme]|uniref:uncharacterized protein n=1 Tax=Hypoxylon fragiforme TaxID=63214 RepID=UPI0020C691A3|nr:uncharacterized protein GGS25DRAFT_440730 [Hypoxylon fragiforme]KAI2603910.1 hypothetical protein GGS25DRAFT_440730 [Hypoxylon fragiforme]